MAPAQRSMLSRISDFLKKYKVISRGLSGLSGVLPQYSSPLSGLSGVASSLGYGRRRKRVVRKRRAVGGRKRRVVRRTRRTRRVARRTRRH